MIHCSGCIVYHAETAEARVTAVQLYTPGPIGKAAGLIPSVLPYRGATP